MQLGDSCCVRGKAVDYYRGYTYRDKKIPLENNMKQLHERTASRCDPPHITVLSTVIYNKYMSYFLYARTILVYVLEYSLSEV